MGGLGRAGVLGAAGFSLGAESIALGPLMGGDVLEGELPGVLGGSTFAFFCRLRPPPDAPAAGRCRDLGLPDDDCCDGAFGAGDSISCEAPQACGRPSVDLS
jgi:hypothetical protein